MKRFLFAAIFVWLSFPLTALADSQAIEAARAFREAHERVILSGFIELLSLPNVASDEADIRANAAHIRALFEARGFAAELLEAPGGPPSLLVSRAAPGAAQTLMIYMHFDGQPVDPDRWATPPFLPAIRTGKLEDKAGIVSLDQVEGPVNPDWRIYARSASDDKAPIAALLAAVDALDGAGIPLSVNLKVFLEGAEEAGSPNLAAIVEANRQPLAADFWLFVDGPQDQRGNPRITLGVRGSFGFDITLYGPVRGLHSGHYGNFSPNPGVRLAHLLAAMRDENGLVLIPGFYDEVLPPGEAERKLIAAIPSADAAIMKGAGLGAREFEGMRYEETHLMPAFNVQGIVMGGVGAKAQNVIEPSATANIGIRTVPAMTFERIQTTVEAFVAGQGYFIVRQDPDLDTLLAHPKVAKLDWGSGGYPAARTSPDDPKVAKLIAIVQGATGGETLIYPTLGGSLPLALIVEPLQVSFANLPIANADNSQHAPNENLRIGHLWRGIELLAAVLAEFGKD